MAELSIGGLPPVSQRIAAEKSTRKARLAESIVPSFYRSIVFSSRIWLVSENSS